MVISNLQSYKSGVVFWYGPMKSWLGGSPNSTHKNTPYRLDKLRSASAEAQLKSLVRMSIELQRADFSASKPLTAINHSSVKKFSYKKHLLALSNFLSNPCISLLVVNGNQSNYAISALNMTHVTDLMAVQSSHSLRQFLI